MGGGQRQIASLYINNDGTNKQLNNAYANINGSKKEIYGRISYHNYGEYKLTTDGNKMWDLVETEMRCTGMSTEDYPIYRYTSDSGDEDVDAEFYVARSYNFNHSTKKITLNNPSLVPYTELTNRSTNNRYSGYYAILAGGRGDNTCIDWSSQYAPSAPSYAHYAWYLLYLLRYSPSQLEDLYVKYRYDYFELSYYNTPYYLWKYRFQRSILTQNKNDYTASSDSVIDADYKYSSSTYSSSSMATEYVYRYNGTTY